MDAGVVLLWAPTHFLLGYFCIYAGSEGKRKRDVGRCLIYFTWRMPIRNVTTFVSAKYRQYHSSRRMMFQFREYLIKVPRFPRLLPTFFFSIFYPLFSFTKSCVNNLTGIARDMSIANRKFNFLPKFTFLINVFDFNLLVPSSIFRLPGCFTNPQERTTLQKKVNID